MVKQIELPAREEQAPEYIRVRGARVHNLICSITILMVVGLAAAHGQRLRIDQLPTGLRPVGIDITFLSSGDRVFVIANSGEDSVSLFRVQIDSSFRSVSHLTTIRRIPAPFAVYACGSDIAVVTSPSDNSVSFVHLVQGTVATVRVGSQPYSAICFLDRSAPGAPLRAAVSNFGDSTLSLLDVASRTIIATMVNVSGNRGWRGVSAVTILGSNSIPTNGTYVLVAGTDANVLTVIEVGNFSVAARVPVNRPSVVRDSLVVSAADNTVQFFNSETLQLIPNILEGPRNAQDYASTQLGPFASIQPRINRGT